MSAGLKFTWDPAKDAANQRKHGIAFAEAATAFTDDRALVIADPDHSEDEDRFILMGVSERLRLLVVCHCYKEGTEIIRIISARRAARREQNTYEERWR